MRFRAAQAHHQPPEHQHTPEAGRWREGLKKAVGVFASAAVLASSLVIVGGTVTAAPAVAADPFLCTPGAVFVQSSTEVREFAVNVDGGAPGNGGTLGTISLGTNHSDNGLGISADGRYAYTVTNSSSNKTLAHLRAMIDISRGEPEAGLERLQSLRRRRGSRAPRAQLRLLDATESALALAAGDVAAARRLTSRSGDLPIVSIGVARVELFDGQHERALRTLASISATGPEDRANIAALEAAVLRRLARADDAATAARRARAITDAYGLRTPFLLLPADDRELFGTAVSDRAPVLTARGAAPRSRNASA